MEKLSVKPSNKFCPQALFLYGTNREDGSPNFGLFCWFSYCWDAELGVMACIGGDKLTKDRIRAENIFSANLVNEPLLPLADYFGTIEGYSPGKMDIEVDVGRGAVLNVPVLNESPVVFELEVFKTIPLNDSDVYICKICNTLVAKELADETRGTNERMKLAAPAVWTGSGVGNYFNINPKTVGATGELKNKLPRKNS